MNKLVPIRNLSTLFPKLFNDDGSDWGSFFTGIFSSPYFSNGNIEETETSFIVTADVPGVTEDDIKIEVKNDNISILAEASTKGAKRSFNLSYTLNGAIDIDKITSVLENGVLTIDLPKKELVKEVTTKTITVTRK